MPNVQIPVVGLDPMQIVACAIHCCDKQPYTMKKNRPKSVSCQRLAHRKHSCVLHSLRNKSGNRLTTENKFSDRGVFASPRSNTPINGKIRIPDVVVGNKIVDAKFPCSTDKVYSQLPMSNTAIESNPTDSLSMMTFKEKNIYGKFKHPVTDQPIGKENVSCLTPADAAPLVANSSCKC